MHFALRRDVDSAYRLAGGWFYNRAMSHAHRFTPFFLAACLCATALAIAQTPAPDTRTSASTVTPSSERSTDRRIEHIHIEDAGSRIDELRVGGETQSITVAPKGGMPAYDVVPSTANRSPATVDRGGSSASGGTRVWKVLGF